MTTTLQRFKTEVIVYAVTGQSQSLQIPIQTTVDPTATPPAFALGTRGGTAPTTSFTNGAWSGTWDPATLATLAITPLVGPAASLVVAPATSYDLWTKVIAGGETFISPCGEITCP